MNDKTNKLTRRQFTLGGAAIGATALSSCANISSIIGGSSDSSSIAKSSVIPNPKPSYVKARVVIVGGGFGGATCAKYLRMLDADIDVTLIEPRRDYYTCPFSNLVLAGARQLRDLRHSYQILRDKYAVNVIHTVAVSVSDSSVVTQDGSEFYFDRAVVSPGVSFRPVAEQIPGYANGIEQKIPHAWQAGAQTALLRRQLELMPADGVVIVCPPASSYRGLAAPYERASLIAHYLQANKNRAKLLILDQKDSFAKQELFQSGWARHYGDIIEWRASEAELELDSRSMRVNTNLGWESGDVINFIPEQHAGKIAHESGLTNAEGWCPVDSSNFASLQVANVHVIGDACAAGSMPKSASAANSQGKVTAAAIAADINGGDSSAPYFTETCYSLLTPTHGIAVSRAYELDDDGSMVSVPGASATSSSAAASDSSQAQEAINAQDWYEGLVSDTFR